MPHLIVSSISGHPWWITLRRCVGMGRANGAAFAMYASTRGSFLDMEPPVDGATVARRRTDRHGGGRSMKMLLVRLILLAGLAAVVVFALLPLRVPVPPTHDDA